MMSLLFRLLTLSLCMVAASSVVQVLVAHILPSVAVAFVDVRVFRSWLGLGMREAAIQAILLGGLYVFSCRGRSSLPDSCRIVSSMLLIVVMIWICVWIGIRVQTEVVGFWLVLTTVQVLVGFAVQQSLGPVNGSAPAVRVSWKRMAFLASGSVFVLTSFIGLMLLFPTPRPSDSFVIELNGGQSVTVDVFEPGDRDNEAPIPAVVILHGVEGATPLARHLVHYPNARAISDQGFKAFFVRYFESSPYARLDNLRKEGQLDLDAIETVRLRDYEDWIAIACRAITEIRNRPDVDPDRVAVIGYSLGCYVGTAASARLCEDGYPCAIVGNFGGIWPEIEGDVSSSFPPIQFHHGELDEVVPLVNVQAAEKLLNAVGARSVELNVYPGQGHVPMGPGSFDLRLLTEKFLRKQFSGL